MTPRASHIDFIMNQNWSGSSFPTPLNTGSFITLAILLRGGDGGGMGEVGDEDGEMGGGDMHGILYLIMSITLLGKTFANSSSLPRGDEIKGLVSSSVLPSFL